MTTRFLQSLSGRSLVAVSSLAVLFALGACSKTDDRTVGQKLDSAVAKTEAAADKAKVEVKDAVNNAEVKAKEASADAKASMDQAAQDAKASAKETTANISTKLDDASITASVSTGLAKDPDLSAIKINVDTKDGVVTLNGPAPTSQAKDRATMIAKAVKGVNSVNNQLMIKAG